MTKNWMLAAVVALAMILPAGAFAHDGHAHKVMGTVAARNDNHVELTTRDGKTVMVMLNAKTTFARGKEKVDQTALKVGERVVVEVVSDKDMTAKAVTLAAVTPTTARK